MSPEERELLEKSVKLAEENNSILRSLHRSMRIRRFMGILYWAIIIGSAVGAYYFIEPFVEQIRETYGGAKTNLEGFNDFLNTFKRQP